MQIILLCPLHPILRHLILAAFPPLSEIQLTSRYNKTLPFQGNFFLRTMILLTVLLFLCLYKYQLARYLAQQIPSVKIGLADLPKEGYCIRFNPVVSSRSKWLDYKIISLFLIGYPAFRYKTFDQKVFRFFFNVIFLANMWMYALQTQKGMTNNEFSIFIISFS